jgi:hypothetical protein
VFGEEARRYYDLERLWRSANKLDIPDQPGVAEQSGISGMRSAARGDVLSSGEAISK